MPTAQPSFSSDIQQPEEASTAPSPVPIEYSLLLQLPNGDPSFPITNSGWITTSSPRHILQVNRDAMEVESSTYTDFISCDRAGRRNAVHDIQREATTISMRQLTQDMGDLAVEGAEAGLGCVDVLRRQRGNTGTLGKITHEHTVVHIPAPGSEQQQSSGSSTTWYPWPTRSAFRT
ncbi:hypothetical protein IHE44_0004512 [Lamprotornis superbus]|uniref:Uncharacterized protein n=1 Tax=Lamprotornis superbus TaxID=245042 RepID=A0A835P0S9_9PASS|nr:hypothetical protein IHE44_0004512 [Lamprotornis superbus]